VGFRIARRRTTAHGRRTHPMTVVILDSEAVSALHSTGTKRRLVLALLETARAGRQRPTTRTFIVPTTVRVEAGWDRTAPASAGANRHPIMDHVLDGQHANVAARIREQLKVSPADAHIGAAISSYPSGVEIAVITSDPDDIAAVSGGRARIISI